MSKIARMAKFSILSLLTNNYSRYNSSNRNDGQSLGSIIPLGGLTEGCSNNKAEVISSSRKPVFCDGYFFKHLESNMSEVLTSRSQPLLCMMRNDFISNVLGVKTTNTTIVVDENNTIIAKSKKENLTLLINKNFDELSSIQKGQYIALILLFDDLNSGNIGLNDREQFVIIDRDSCHNTDFEETYAYSDLKYLSDLKFSGKINKSDIYNAIDFLKNLLHDNKKMNLIEGQFSKIYPTEECVKHDPFQTFKTHLIHKISYLTHISKASSLKDKVVIPEDFFSEGIKDLFFSKHPEDTICHREANYIWENLVRGTGSIN